MAFNQGASWPQGTITAKSTGNPQNAWRLKLKKIQKVGAGGAKKVVGPRALPAPPAPRSLIVENNISPY